MCAPHRCHCSAHTPIVSANGQQRPGMCRPTLIHAVCCQPPCGSSCALTWMNVVSRAPQLRSARVLCIRAASLGRLVGSVAKKLGYSKLAMNFACRGWRYGVNSTHVWRTLNVWSNVDARPFPATGSRICTPATRPVGFMLSGHRAGAW